MGNFKTVFKSLDSPKIGAKRLANSPNIRIIDLNIPTYILKGILKIKLTMIGMLVIA